MPVIDHWWQTETGWAIASSCLGIDTPTVIPGFAWGNPLRGGIWLPSIRMGTSWRRARWVPSA